MAIAVVPVVICVVGLLMWALASNPKVSEAGRIMFFCGMLALTMSLAGKTVHIG